MSKIMYGVFTPRGDLMAAFDDYRAADAMARYDWKAVGERLYWSIAPQMATISRIEVEPQPPADPHRLSELDRSEVPDRCSAFDCPRHANA